MLNQAEFKTGRGSNMGVGLGLFALTGCILYVALFMSEEDLLGAHIRRGGIFKLFEQLVGWEVFVAIMLTFGLWTLNYAIVFTWKALDSTPDVLATADGLRFHPAVKRTSASYDEISHWSIEYVSGHPVVWVHFIKPYWSLQGLFRRKAIKLEGRREELASLVSYFAGHHLMSRKFAA